MTTTWNILIYSSINYHINRKGACCNVSSKFFFSARPINIYWRASWLSCRRPLLVPTFQSYFLSCSHPILSFTLFPHSQDISTPWNISTSQNIFALVKYFHTIPKSPPHSHVSTLTVTLLRYFNMSKIFPQSIHIYLNESLVPSLHLQSW